LGFAGSAETGWRTDRLFTTKDTKGAKGALRARSIGIDRSMICWRAGGAPFVSLVFFVVEKPSRRRLIDASTLPS
jgi:hypothetical protein